MSFAEESVLLDGQNPWPGLLSFAEEAEAYFSGREDERDELFRLVRKSMLTLLDGLPGLGKTSLLRAGLFPLLRRHHFFPVYLRLDHSPSSPPLAEQLRTAILLECERHGITPPPTHAEDGLWEFLHRARPTEEEDAVAYGFWSETRVRAVMPVLVLDQFEELVTLGAATPERVAAFVDELGRLVRNDPPKRLSERLLRAPQEVVNYDFEYDGYRVLLSAREDYTSALNHALRDSTGNITADSLRLRPFSGKQAHSAILTTAGHLVAADVAQRIVQVVAGAEGGEELAELEVAPAILSVFCRQLNEERKRHGEERIGADLLQRTEGGIIAGFYHDNMKDVSAELRVFIEDKLLTESGDHRTSRPAEDLLKVPGGDAGLRRLLGVRLLTSQHRFGTDHVELTHDVLIDVVKTSRAQRRLLEAEAAERARAEKERAEQQRRLEAEQQRRLEAERRRRRRAAAVVGVAILVAIGSAWNAQGARERALEFQRLQAEAEAAWEVAAAQRDTAFEAAAVARAALDSAQAATERAEREEQNARTAAERAEQAWRVAMLEVESTDNFKRQSASLIERSVALDSVSRLIAVRLDSLQAGVQHRARFVEAAACRGLAVQAGSSRASGTDADKDAQDRQRQVADQLQALRDSALVWLSRPSSQACRP